MQQVKAYVGWVRRNRAKRRGLPLWRKVTVPMGDQLEVSRVLVKLEYCREESKDEFTSKPGWSTLILPAGMRPLMVEPDN